MPEPAKQLAPTETATPRHDGAPPREDGAGPFPRWSPIEARERSALQSDGGRQTLAVPNFDATDPFRELLEATTPERAEAGRVAGPLRDMVRRERTYRRSLATADILATLLAVYCALVALGGYGLRPLFLLVIPLVVLSAKLSGLYDRDEHVLDHSTSNELPRLLNLATLVALLTWIARHYLVLGAPNTVDLLTMWMALMMALVLGRSIARRLSARLTPVERCAVIGRPAVYARIHEKLRGHSRVELAGRIDPDAIVAEPEQLGELAQRARIHRLIIDTNAAGPDETLEIVRFANASGLQVSLVPTALGAVGSGVAFDDIGGLMLMGVPRFGLSRSSLMLKRAFDLAVAAVALVLFAPLMVMIAVAIKLDSRGPAFFRQTRMGRNERPFRMLKFRSMVDGADALKESLRARNEADGLFKIDADPRITRVGRWIRRSGLDELPQLFNVLGGSMSIVGPRPLVIDEDRRVTGSDRRRLHLTPGITGRWQTLGAARVPLTEMVKIDYLYIANWSPWLDLRIIMDTLGFLVRRRGQ